MAEKKLNLEERTKEADKALQRIEYMGAFSGGQEQMLQVLAGTGPYTPRSQSIKYLDAIVEFANKAKKKYGQESKFDKWYTFKAKEFVSSSMEKLQTYTVADYIKAAEMFKVGSLDEETKKRLMEYGKENFYQLHKKLKRKYDDAHDGSKGKIDTSEESLLFALETLTKDIHAAVAYDVKAYADKMYDPNRKRLAYLERMAKLKPKGEEAKLLKGIRDAIKPSEVEDPDKAYAESAKPAKLKVYDLVK